jgi:hypothetical protein
MYRKYQIELEQETDGRWIAEIGALLSAMVYGDTRASHYEYRSLGIAYSRGSFRAWRSCLGKHNHEKLKIYHLP